MALRSLSSSEYKKKPVGLCFTGKEGYKALDVLSQHKDFGYSKSGLVVELLNIYWKARKVYGDSAMFKLQEFVNKEIE